MTIDLARPRLRSRKDPWTPEVSECLDHLISSRIRNNQNVLAAICGETGSGKSYAAMRLGELCDPNFSIDNVVFSIPEFLDKLGSSGPGDVLIFDESQAWGARRAMSKKNVEMTDIAAMCRFTLVNVLFTAPALSFIDVSLRRLMHLYIQVTPLQNRARWPPRYRNKTRIVPRIVIRPSEGGDLHYAIPRVPVVRGGVRRRVKTEVLWLNAPSPELLEAYERRKHDVFGEKLRAARGAVGVGTTPRPQADSSSGGAADLLELLDLGSR
ncbi:hypothetical protein [Methanoculleus bourgensis]|uniref:hypothetical protein n=1 Tax=Methanoculleus bourgensis TaxID=83986 RepID=UPI002FDA421C